MKKFKLVVWSGGRGRFETIVYASSYNVASNTHLSMLPPAYIGTLEPLDD